VWIVAGGRRRRAEDNDTSATAQQDTGIGQTTALDGRTAITCKIAICKTETATLQVQHQHGTKEEE
jgi:hypothetical protein